MTISGKKETIALFLGDVVLLYFSLWSALALREWGVPSSQTWELHLWPFTIIMGVWVLVFFISGLYEKHTLILKSRLPSTAFNASDCQQFLSPFSFSTLFHISASLPKQIFLYI